MSQLEFLQEHFFSPFHGSQIMGWQIRDNNILISFALDFHQNGGRFIPRLCQYREDNVQGSPLNECVFEVSIHVFTRPRPFTQNPMDCPKLSSFSSFFKGLWPFTSRFISGV